jgi:lipid-binding SYLF domain-containing protein
MLALAACFVSLPVAAQIFSWDPLKDVQEVLPEGTPSESKVIQGRHQVREMAQDALAALYEIAPGTRRVIERSAGYAVFSTFGVKLFFAGGTTGKGMVVNLRTRRQAFMKMVQVQGGLGFGVNQNRLIFVFANEPALKNFINQGWEFGGQVNLSAMAGGQGGMFSGAAAVSPGVYLYQLTQTGLSATLTVGGGAGAANAIRPAACAFADANVSVGSTGSSRQFEKSISWRSASGSAAKIARIRRGSLSSAPSPICTNTSSFAHTTMSVFVPPITAEGPT